MLVVNEKCNVEYLLPIVTEIGVEGTVPRPRNTDPVPETRGHFRPRLVKTSHEDHISFLDPIDPESL